MVKSFFIKNFCSIKDKIDVSLEASNLSDVTSFENTFKFKTHNILKVMSFYGANASGKSSIIKALAALREVAVGTPIRIDNTLPYNPFAFSTQTQKAPTELGIEFSLDNENQIFYRYEVSFNKTSIVYEKFEKYASQKPTLLFERTLDNGNPKIIFGSTIQNNPLFQQLGNSIIKNKTFISMFSNFKIDDFSDAYVFFRDRMINISPEVTRFDDVLPLNIKKNPQLKTFTEKLLRAADFDIDNMEIKRKPVRVPAIVPGYSPEFERETLVFNHHGNECDGSIEFLNESLGTKKILIIASHLYRALQKPTFLIIDELESSLHPDLARLIVETFLDQSINVHNSQLIFSSHNAALLDLDLFRREQINFVYKNKDNCSTFIRSLKDFHVRQTDSIDKSYLAGRYSTSPDVNKELIA